MIWIPIGLGIFKFTVFGTAMFFAIKSHRDRAREVRAQKEASAAPPSAASDAG